MEKHFIKNARIILSVCTLSFVGSSYGQSTSNSSTTFGLRAGVNFQNLNGKNSSGDKMENGIKTGFHVGANAEIPVAPDYFIQPGILFSTKGATFADEEGKINLSYIEIPVNFLYKPQLGTNRLVLGFGPYAAFGVAGKVKRDNFTDSDIEFKSSISTSDLASEKTFIKRFDAGANFLAGYELSNKLSFQLNAQLGLVNINPEYEENTSDKSSVKNTGFGLSVGYRF